MLNPFNNNKNRFTSQLVLGIGFFLFLLGCTTKDKHAEGEKLARSYCASCHLFPDPTLLPRRVWGEKILPNMGLQIGMAHGPIYSYGNPEANKNLNPIMPQEEWDKIVHYYLNESENSIPKYPIQDQEYSTLWEPHIYAVDSLPIITMISYDEKSKNLFLGDGSNSRLLTLDMDGNVLSSEKLDSPPVKIIYRDSLQYLLTIGVLSPSDEPKGKLRVGDNLIEELTRPVDLLIKDINQDGNDDIFVCSYGNNIGDFSWFENLGNESYTKRLIYPLSGAIKVEIANMDADEENEIVVLFAQEHELIMIFDYENNVFTGKKAFQFQPAFGSVDFQLSDMDGDGLKDIIIGNGDNSDLSIVLKNFHGVRVLLNKGNKEFSEDYFLPIHGVSKIVAEDFDLDGDTDILSVSNFGDFTDPKFRSVQFLRNEGGLKFKPEYINGLPNFRWQTIDVSDYDNDGDKDAFIGAFKLNLGPKESYISDTTKISWVKLENKLK